MPKYTCRRCGTECYGRIIYTLKACHVCAEPIHEDDVQDEGRIWSRRSPKDRWRDMAP